MMFPVQKDVITRIFHNGDVRIPKQFRDKLGLSDGYVQWILDKENNCLILQKAEIGNIRELYK